MMRVLRVLPAWAAAIALGGLFLGASVLAGPPEAEEDKAPGRRLAQSATKGPGARWTTTDHAKLEALQKEFASPEEVTAACLSCHQKAADQIQHTIHWTWRVAGPDGKTMGKYGDTINNYCIAVPSNEPRCTSCHIGYGFKDKNFDFTAKNKIDCLVCHDTTHTYDKFPTKAGYPATEPTLFPEDGKTYQPPDYRKIAGAVGLPDRVNCGTCHFYGGGGDAVKHGDLDSSMAHPGKALDVHMDAKGQNFSCQRCHTTREHRIAGRMYATPATAERVSLTEGDMAAKIACESCHGHKPHKDNVKANDHTDKVACQTCHIPTMAREVPTKMRWDWSTAGKMNAEGKPFKTKGPLGKPSYDTKKGDFLWAKDVEPVYFWSNGGMDYLVITDTIDPTGVVSLNRPTGSPADGKSRIMPFKRHEGNQPYDAGNKTMVIPKLFGPPGSDAYWAGYDWGKAIAAGMAAVNKPFSGEYGFVRTEYFFPTTHMVAEKDKALDCEACHAPEGRLKGIAGVYVPGRDRHVALSAFGWGGAGAAVLAVLIHGAMRVFSRGNGRKGE